MKSKSITLNEAQEFAQDFLLREYGLDVRAYTDVELTQLIGAVGLYLQKQIE
jgi:hypothetical protein